MSVSSLPEWKQLLLERKRREEEERERKEKQEEEKFATMPAWKRGIIQRRKAKQDSDREKEKDDCLLHGDARFPSDVLSEKDSCLTINLGSEVSLSPDPGQWLDAEVKTESQVSVETIVPVHENPFIRTQCSWRKGRDTEAGNEQEVQEREKDKLSPRNQDCEPARGRDIEMKKERFRDLNEGWQKARGRDRSQVQERENSRGRWEKDKSQWKESVAIGEREFLKVRKGEEDKDPLSDSFTPLVPCLRTIRADNIIIIEQDRKGCEERRGKWKEADKERSEVDQEKRGTKMGLREILAVGGNVTEIRASEVLIIKPSESSEERNALGGGGTGRHDGEMKRSMEGKWESLGQELRTDLCRPREKEKPWGQATVIPEDRKDSLDDNVFVDRGNRVSQLLTKFGDHPKPPPRSKSSDNFLRPGRRKYSGDEEEQQSEVDGKNVLLKGVPKRSFSFSDHAIRAKQNGLENDGHQETRMRERTHSEKSVVPWINVRNLRKETTSKIKLGCARLLEKDRFGMYRERHLKNEFENGRPACWGNEANMSIQHKCEVKKLEPIDTRAQERSGNADEDEVFTVASVKKTEGISFARRVPIRQEGRARAEKEEEHQAGERKLRVECISEAGGQIKDEGFEKNLSDVWRKEEFRSTPLPDSMQKSQILAPSVELAISGNAAEGQHRHETAFTECSGLHSSVIDRSQDPHRGSQLSSTGPQNPYCVLSKYTEDLLSKIQKIGDTPVYNNKKGEMVFKGACELTEDIKQGVHLCNEIGSESIVHDTAPRSPKMVTSVRPPPEPQQIQIPRTVFYVAEEMMDSQKGHCNEEQDREEHKGVERRDSWRIGKPLSRIESLREKIRQRELESLKQRQTAEGGDSEGAEINFSLASEERHDDRRTEIKKEGEADFHMWNRLVEIESGQEDTVGQTSTTAFDVTQEVNVLKTCPQLPVSVPNTQADRGEEVTRGCITATSEVSSDNLQISEDDGGPAKHVEEQLGHQRDQQEKTEEKEEEETELSEEVLEEYTSPSHPNTLAAMSRIYNLQTVGSRTGLCLRERPVDIPTVHLVKVKPLISNAQQGDSKAFSSEDICGVQTIQRQIEQLQLKEQEVLSSCTSRGTKTKGQQSPRGLSKHKEKDNEMTQEEDQETSKPKVTAQHVQSPTSQIKQSSNQTITITPSLYRSQSPDDTLKPSDCTPTPASSPSSLSPAQSRSVSPSPTPSPTLFSIRSASGGKVKRGATITISPRKPAGVGGSTAGSTVPGLTPAVISTQQAQMASVAPEPMKKKYPTVEEIEVIGGYQNLDKSCLVKNRVALKRVSGSYFLFVSYLFGFQINNLRRKLQNVSDKSCLVTFQSNVHPLALLNSPEVVKSASPHITCLVPRSSSSSSCRILFTVRTSLLIEKCNDRLKRLN